MALNEIHIIEILKRFWPLRAKKSHPPFENFLLQIYDGKVELPT